MYLEGRNDKQRGESAKLRRLRQQLAQVTMERAVLKKALAISRSPRNAVTCHRGVGRSLPRSASVPAAVVLRSGFYAWQQRPPSTREMANRRLSKEIRTIQHEGHGIYSHRRIQAELTAMEHARGRYRVARLMREAGLSARSRKSWRLISSSRHDLHMRRIIWIASASDRAIGIGSRTIPTYVRPKVGCIWR